MMKMLSRTLAVMLAIICALNFATVSFATSAENTTEDDLLFDEATGTLYLNEEQDIYDVLGDEEYVMLYNMEIPKMYAEIREKVKTVSVGKDFMTDQGMVLMSYMLYFPNVEEIIVEDGHPLYEVYDNALYTEGYDAMLYYPPYCEDVDIVLHENARYIYDYCFLDLDLAVFIGGTYYPATDKEYNLYITQPGQIQKIIDSQYSMDMNCQPIFYGPFANIYVNETQETLDNLRVSEEIDYPATIQTLYDAAIYTGFNFYFSMNNYYNDDVYPEKFYEYERIIYEITEGMEDEEDLTFDERCDMYADVYSRIIDAFMELGFDEYTREEFDKNAKIEYSVEQAMIDMFGDNDETFEIYSDILKSYEEHILYLYNRGNPMKPLSTLTSGTCGEGAEWTIDRETGTLTITGEGKIDDNYTGFDVFKDTVKIIELGRGITVIGENAFNGFDALENTVYKGTHAEWDAIDIYLGNEDLVRKVTIDPDEIPEPEEPTEPDTPSDPDSETPEEPAPQSVFDIIAEFFNDMFKTIRSWFENLFKF